MVRCIEGEEGIDGIVIMTLASGSEGMARSLCVHWVVCHGKERKTSVGKDADTSETSYTGRWKCKMVQLLCKVAWQFFKRLNIEPPHDPAIPHLNMYPRAMKTYVRAKTYSQIVIAPLFTVTKRWKQSKYPSVEWTNNICVLMQWNIIWL